MLHAGHVAEGLQRRGGEDAEYQNYGVRHLRGSIEEGRRGRYPARELEQLPIEWRENIPPYGE